MAGVRADGAQEGPVPLGGKAPMVMLKSRGGDVPHDNNPPNLNNISADKSLFAFHAE